MFDIYGDELCFDRTPFATVLPGVLATVRDRFEEYLRELPTEDEIEKRVKDESDDAREQGREDGADAAIAEVEKLRQEIREDAFADGKAEGIALAGMASETGRVECLLEALATVEAALRSVLNGVVEPGQFRPRAPKVSELKTAINGCCNVARRARADFNGSLWQRVQHAETEAA